jgi:Ca-activated chloride channel family protein
MAFSAPWALLLLPFVPALVWLLARRPRPVIVFSDLRLFDGLPPGRAKRALWGRHFLRGLALAAGVLALAGPRWPDRDARLPAEGVALALVVDVSGSMGDRDFVWPGETNPISRLEAVRRALRLLVAGGVAPDGVRFPGRPADQIGLVVFASWPEQRSPLTLSHSVLLALLDAEQPRSGSEAGLSNLGDAIGEGLRRLEAAGPRRRKVLVLLSDGEHNFAGDPADPALRPRQAARLAAALGVTIHCVDAGGEVDDKSAAAREAGRENLRAVARMTGGRYFAPDNSAGLLRVVEEIDRLERRPVESEQARPHFEAAPALALLAFAALAVLVLLEQTRWRVEP